MSGFRETLQTAGELLVVFAAFGLAVVGLILGKRRGDDAEDPGVAQERRLEQEEDTRDQGPI